jgi:GNAT superfamily N-acetyltransferase
MSTGRSENPARVAYVQPDRWLLVAELDAGQIVGTVDLLIVENLTHGARPWAIVENVVVAESHHRRGIGSALMQDAIRRAKSANCYKLQLVSGTQRGPAHLFYRALGLEAVAEGFKISFGS